MTRLFILLAAAALTSTAAAQQTSENNDRLKDALKRFPAADADKDGVLTFEEARTFWRKRQAANPQAHTKRFTPTEEEIAATIKRGREKNNNGPLRFEKGNGVRVVMTGHSWVAPGRNTLLRIAAGAGLEGHRQRHHTGGGATGSANAIWLKEFGKWKEDPAKPILVPAIATGEWDVMTWGAYINDQSEYFTQWIDLCLRYNPEMTFMVQDGWPRYSPKYKDQSPEEVLGAMKATLKQYRETIFVPEFEKFEKLYPGKLQIIPAGSAVVDIIGQFYAGELPNLDCVDEKSEGGSSGVYRDGGHLSRESGIEHLVGYVYYGMLYRKSPALIDSYTPENIPPAFDKRMRKAAWNAIVESPFARVDDEDKDGVAD